MPKVILISQMPLPFTKIGSWTTLYKNYIEGDHLIDSIVCLQPEKKWDSIDYSFVPVDYITKLDQKWTKNPYKGYIKALNNILKPDEKYIIQIIDNFGIVKPLISFLEKSGMRQQVYLQFFYHGFPPFYENFRGRWFFEAIDEMVVLTNDSYREHKKSYTVLPTRFSVLHNGIDTRKFTTVSTKEKQALKEAKGVAEKIVFVWCSQDRPKKGLVLLLDAWQRVYAKQQDIVLWVIGCEPKKPIDGVEYLGRIPNNELPIYLQSSDCYLFPTLCHEGFGLSLIEALHCGNYCIASAIGGVPEVLQYGKLGKLIENPHFVSEWEDAILTFIQSKPSYTAINRKLYSSERWSQGMNTIIMDAKKTLENASILQTSRE